MRVVFLPPVPLNAIPGQDILLIVKRRPLEEVKKTIDALVRQGARIECYIRHESTVRVLNQALGLDLKPSNALYRYQEGDVLIVVGLKKPVRGQEVADVTIDDLDIAIVSVVTEESGRQG